MRKKIGEVLIAKGVLTEAQVQQILNYASIRGLRFGEAGMEMGLLTRESMVRAFGPNYLVDFFHLEPAYFPQATRALFDAEFVVRWGILPLGYKTVGRFLGTKKVLNIGLIDPSRTESVEAVERLAREKLGSGYAGLKSYLVLADEFVSVMESVYQVPAKEMVHFTEVDPTLKLFLDSSP